jgi:hypothetical protein
LNTKKPLSTKKHLWLGIILNVVILVVNFGQKWVLLSLKIMFLRFLSVKYVLNWPGSSLFRFYSVRAFFWYQNWVFRTLRSHFIAKNSGKLSIWLILAIFRLFWQFLGHKFPKSPLKVF